MSFSNVLKEIKSNWHQKQLIRYLIFAHKKKTAFAITSLTAAFGVFFWYETKNIKSMNNSFSNTIYSSDKTARRNDTILIYDYHEKLANIF